MLNVLKIIILILFCSNTLEATTKYVSIQSVKAYVRSGPGKQYKVLKKVGKYTPFRVLARSADGGWLRVEDYTRKTGWLSKEVISNTPAVIIKSSEANVRNGPGTNYEKIWQAVQGVPFRCLKRSGRWLRVLDVDDEIGWVYDALVWGICF